MKTAKRLFALGAVVALLAIGLSPISAQAQPQTLEVDVGALLAGAPAEGMRFYAPTIRVHSGDTLTFDFKSFHTATLLPAETDVHSWVEDNVRGIDKPWSLIINDPDDTDRDPGGSSPDRESWKANNPALFEANPLCGSTGEPACAYDRTDVLNSGVQVLFNPDDPKWSALINGNVGDTIWVICLPHHHMRLRIEVVDPTEDRTTQADLDAFRSSERAQDRDDAATLHQELLNTRTRRNGMWHAYAGYDTHRLTLYGMYPRRLNIRRGQTVRFHFSQMVFEDHTATFPRSKALPVANGAFLGGLACDPDGDVVGGAEDNPPDSTNPPFCTNPTQLELDVQPRFAYETGNGVFSGSDYENSGAKGAGVDTFEPWDLRFASASGGEPFKYICLIHPFMRGQVAVRRP